MSTIQKNNQKNSREMREVYERAEALMPWKLDDAVLNGRPQTVWISDTEFFYARQSREKGAVRTDFILYNAKKKEARELFDADELAGMLGENVLPFRTAQYHDGILSFTRKQSGDKQDAFSTAIETCKASFNPSAAAKTDYEYEIETKTLRKLGCRRQRTAVPSPDGTKEIFVKGYDLFLRDLSDGSERRLTFDGEKDFAYGAEAEQINVVRERLAGIEPEAGVLWSHDSRKFLTYRLDMRAVKEFYIIRSFDQEGRESIRPELLSYKCSLPEDDHVPLAYLYLGDTESGSMRRVSAPPIAASHFVLNRKYMMAQWLEDDSCVYYTSTERGDKDGYFHIINAADGSVRTVVHEHSDLFLNLGTYGRYDGFGAYPYSNFLTSDGKWVFWQSERGGKARIYRYDAHTGELVNPVTPEESIAGVLMKKDEEQEWLYYMANDLPGMSDPYYHALCRVHFDGSGFEVLTPEDGEHAVKMGEKYFTDTWSRADLPPVTVLRSLDGEFIDTIEKADISELLAKGYQMPERFEVTASDGVTKLYGILIRPAGQEAGKEYPVIDYIYGGMQCCNVPKDFTWESFGGREIFGGLQSFAQLGFAGVMLDGLGTPGRGMKIHAVSYENIHGCAGLKDHVFCMKELKQKYPFLDWTRAGIWGNSGGGCATARAMLEYPDAYKAGVSAAGNHDQRMYDNMWTERYYGFYKPEIYLKGDNTALAPNLKGKLLIVHGAMDCNVSHSQSLRLVDALIRADKEFDFLTLPRTNHNVPGNPYFIRRKLDYFVRHLLGEEPPADYHFSVSNLLDRSVE